LLCRSIVVGASFITSFSFFPLTLPMQSLAFQLCFYSFTREPWLQLPIFAKVFSYSSSFPSAPPRLSSASKLCFYSFGAELSSQLPTSK
jgi:hypothetical protein